MKTKIDLTNNILKSLCFEGQSDAAIGAQFNMTGEGVAYRRKLIGISVNDKYNASRENTKILKNTSKEELSKDYYCLNQEEFSKKYRVSKTIWGPILKEKGIVNKTEFIRNSFPPFNAQQRNLIIGSLLGDGSVSQKVYFYEGHSNKQKMYLYKKHEIMKPYSGHIFPVDEGTGLRFKTVYHNNFIEFYDQFYKKGVKGKQIPLEYLRNNWSEDILAYWFFDDGYYNDETNELFIANKAPLDQSHAIIDFLNEKYNWSFRLSIGKDINNITISKKYYSEFFKTVLNIATPDLYYKIPENLITPDMVNQIPGYCDIMPKFYRKAHQDTRILIFEKVLLNLKSEGFPEPKLTDGRINYYLRVVKSNPNGCGNAWLNLYEIACPQLYDEARRRWSSESFLIELTSVLLNEYKVMSIRDAVRKMLGIKVVVDKEYILRYFRELLGEMG